MTSGLQSNPLIEAERLRVALRLLLNEAKSGQHRHDRQNMACKPMEEAIERAEAVLRRRASLPVKTGAT